MCRRPTSEWQVWTASSEIRNSGIELLEAQSARPNHDSERDFHACLLTFTEHIFAEGRPCDTLNNRMVGWSVEKEQNQLKAVLILSPSDYITRCMAELQGPCLHEKFTLHMLQRASIKKYFTTEPFCVPHSHNSLLPQWPCKQRNFKIHCACQWAKFPT